MVLEPAPDRRGGETAGRAPGGTVAEEAAPRGAGVGGPIYVRASSTRRDIATLLDRLVRARLEAADVVLREGALAALELEELATAIEEGMPSDRAIVWARQSARRFRRRTRNLLDAARTKDA